MDLREEAPPRRLLGRHHVIAPIYSFDFEIMRIALMFKRQVGFSLRNI